MSYKAFIFPPPTNVCYYPPSVLPICLSWFCPSSLPTFCHSPSKYRPGVSSSPYPAISHPFSLHPNSGVTTDPHHALVPLPLTPSSYPSFLYTILPSCVSPVSFHLFILPRFGEGSTVKARQDRLPILSSGESLIQTPSNVTKENNHTNEKVECVTSVFICVQPIP